eukprot:TRINITY_DN8022_c0_g1_i1.p1 TRINITY_DN8022_c0_g1~~TRINITY_DN8022_c0_g1_i1.p1  ORF type:complete len:106 (+),score=10.92 TRINITY_DN8022_c0_g1_i1:173-490(+)
MHLVCCEEYSKHIERIIFRLLERVAPGLLFGVSSPQADALELEIDQTDDHFASRFVAVLHAIQSLATASSQDRFQLLIEFAASGLEIQQSDRTHAAAFAILTSNH